MNDSDVSRHDRPASTTWRGAFRLTRASLALSPIADGLAGMALAAQQQGWPRADQIALGLTASLLLFCFGMAQNDLADRDRDQGSRRPLITGEASVRFARNLVFVVSGGCVFVALLLPPAARSIIFAMLVLISSYNLGPRHLGFLGTIVLGAIRGLDLSLGAAVAGDAKSAIPTAITYGAVITAISCISRMEDGVWRPTRGRVFAATSVAAVAVCAVPFTIDGDHGAGPRVLATTCSLLWLFFVLRALRSLVAQPITPGVALARYVGTCLSGIFFIDASVAAAVGEMAVSFVILLMFPVARALVRTLPPS